MVLAHGPAGYLLSRSFPKSWKTAPITLMAILGGIAPDFDFIINILGISDLNHRAFATHTPSFWIMSWLVAWSITKIRRADARPVHAFFMGATLHVLLDIPTGIRVFAPLWNEFILFFPDLYFNVSLIEFLTHPYVVAEILIILLALLVWKQQRAQQ